MKIKIEANSQEEFDEKRHELIKAIAGSHLEVSIRKAGQKSATETREPHYKAQREMLHFWDEKFKVMLRDLRTEIGEVIENIR